MAEPISIQQLKNASEDAISLGEAVNGDENSVVTTRLGETYPTLSNALNQIDSKLDSADTQIKQGITTLFENGGLPATPFATKALMTASALADGKYAMVTDDTINNGLYVKTSGAWVKSNYDPSSISNNYTNAEVNKSLFKAKAYTDSTHKLQLVEMTEVAKGSFTKDGTFSTNSGTSTSDFIAVKKNECYLLKNLKEDNLSMYSFALFDSNKVFVGVMGSHRLKNSDFVTEQDFFSLGVGQYNKKESLGNCGVIIPADGFMKVSYRTSGEYYFSNHLKNDTLLYKTDYMTFVENTSTALPDGIMKKFEGILTSVTADTDLTKSGLGNIQVAGSPIRFNGAGHYVSNRIAVKKGQFIHLHTYSELRLHSIVYEDELGNYLDSSYIVTPYTTPNGAYSLTAPINVKAKFTGYIRVHAANSSTTSFLIGVTDNEINHPVNYIEKGISSLVFNPALGSDTSYKISDSFGVTTLVSTTYHKDNVNSSHTASIPYVLKKGDVVEYSAKATSSPLLAMVIEYRKDVGTSALMASKDLNVPLLATEVVSIEQGQVWLLAGKPSTPNYFADASKGTIAYCNEETDVVIIFYRPNKLNPDYTTFKQNQGYSINLMSKEEYTVKRNKELKSRFALQSFVQARTDNRGSSLEIARENPSRATFPSVLMFKGEVINYRTSGFGEIGARGLSEINLRDNSYLHFSNIASSYRRLMFTSPDYKPLVLSLPIKESNKLSSFIDQVYCHKTMNVHLGLLYLTPDFTDTLDVERIIRDVKFEPKIMMLEDAVINKDLIPCSFQGNQSKYSEDIKLFSPIYTGTNDSLATFLGKGQGVEITTWGNSSQWVNSSHQVPLVANLTPSSLLEVTSSPILPLYNPEGKDEPVLRKAQGMCTKNGFIAEENSFVAVASATNYRDRIAMLQDGDVTVDDIFLEDTPAGFHLMEEFYELSMDSIPANEVIEKYKITDKTYFDLPVIEDITFNFCTLVSSGMDEFYSLAQILIAGKVVITFHALTANQGQSTAGSLRRNVNIEMFNDKFEKLYIKFGDAIEQTEIVLKSYLKSDRGHFKDTTSTDLWYKMRHVDPYPVGGVIPNYMFEDLTTPSNQVARASTYAFPVTHNRAEKFYGLATLKFKKKRENYAMEKNNRSHILLQADWQLSGGGQLSWNNPSLTKMEVRNPSMSGYTEGDETLPPAYIDVENNITRILNWLKGVHTGTIDARSTYMDFVNLDSLIDYAISMAVVYNVDGRTNNFMMGTHDGVIWDFYIYDTDQTFGSFNNQKVHYSTMLSGDVFSSVLTKLAPEVKARYAKQRREGVINVKRLQAQIMELSNFSSVSKKTLDIDYWGEWQETAGVPYAMSWIYHRINFLDAYFDYVDTDSNIITQGVRTLSELSSGASREYSYINTPASVGDLLSVEFGEPLEGTILTANCSTEGTITVTHTNPTAETVKLNTSYLRIRRL